MSPSFIDKGTNGQFWFHRDHEVPQVTGAEPTTKQKLISYEEKVERIGVLEGEWGEAREDPRPRRSMCYAVLVAGCSILDMLRRVDMLAMLELWALCDGKMCQLRIRPDQPLDIRGYERCLVPAHIYTVDLTR